MSDLLTSDLMTPGTPVTAAALALDTHWAIEPVWARNAVDVLNDLDYAAHLADWEAKQTVRDAAAKGDKPDQKAPNQKAPKPYEMQDGTAVLRLTGPMTKGNTSMSYLFGGTSTSRLRRTVRQAGSDPDVSAILMILDSPGGSVSGTGDLAAEVAAARDKKPVIAYIEDMCASAAYWVASQADAVYANPTALIGSIGTYMTITDRSRAAENDGYKVHVVRAGKFKGAGASGTPITDEHLSAFQDEVDALNSHFVSAVAAGRKMTPQQVQEIADGRVHVGPAAVNLGLIDGLATLDTVLADAQQKGMERAAQHHSFPRKETSMSLWDQFKAALGGDETAPAPPANPAAGPISPPASYAVSPPASYAVSPPASYAVSPPASYAVSHPVLAACLDAGLDTPAKVADLSARAKLGDEYAALVRTDAKGQAVRAYGAEAGQKMAAICDTLPVAEVKGLAEGWKAETDARHSLGETGANRTSAPGFVPKALNAEGGTEPQTAWERLSADQQKIAAQMGYTTPEKCEAYAKTVLSQKEGK